MKEFKATPAQELLQELLDYDEDTGILTWKRRRKDFYQKERDSKEFNTRWAGKRAGIIHRGRREIALGPFGGKYPASRIIWKLVYGVDSPFCIDHKDNDPLNDRLDNLREATKGQNAANARMCKLQKNGYKGVHKTKSGRYEAKIVHRTVVHWLGTHDTPEEAHAAYCEATTRLNKEFANYG
jgi:hypothetical protein